MISFDHHELWFVTGSQHLYGDEALRQVADDAKQVVAALDAKLPVKLVWKPTVTRPEEATRTLAAANADERCIGLVFWCHTFSPAKMWIAGLSKLTKPYCHLHTQFGRDIPWSSIDMDYMNLHQSAHGDREFGHLCSRLRQRRSVVVGHWQEPAVHAKLDAWTRAAAAWADAQTLKVARFGDNMREVAVTEGDKVEAQLKLGYSVSGYGLGDLVAVMNDVTDKQVDELCHEYDESYEMAAPLRQGGDQRDSLRTAAKIELALRTFLVDGGFGAYTDTFENLTGLDQLPGIASQRLMADGFGFGAEGDWKHAALVRSMKVMAHGLKGGVSFMEDYTYHFDPAGPAVLGSHMLEICPSIAAGKPRCEIHPLGIGGKADPVRLVFNGTTGPAINASVVDLGDRFRLIVNTVDAVEPYEDLPKLPVARVLWKPRPNLADAAAAWIYAGGAHHTGYSPALTAEHMEAFADMADVEYLVIDQNTKVRPFRQEILWNDAAYRVGR